MSDISSLIRKIRGKDSLRKATEKTGISYTYWSILEKGVDPRSKSPIKPSPDTLKAISNGYQFPYDELMRVAGYLEEDEKGNVNTFPEEKFIQIVRETEAKYNVTLHNDPVALETMRQILEQLAHNKHLYQNKEE